MTITFRTYLISEHNPFDQFPKGVMVLATPDEQGMYTVHVQLKNGLVLSSVEKYDLHLAGALVKRYVEGLEYPDDAWYIDVPAHVLEQDNVYNRRMKQEMMKTGLYHRLYGFKKRSSICDA
jgi:hypothetical protein